MKNYRLQGFEFSQLYKIGIVEKIGSVGIEMTQSVLKEETNIILNLK